MAKGKGNKFTLIGLYLHAICQQKVCNKKKIIILVFCVLILFGSISKQLVYKDSCLAETKKSDYCKIYIEADEQGLVNFSGTIRLYKDGNIMDTIVFNQDLNEMENYDYFNLKMIDNYYQIAGNYDCLEFYFSQFQLDDNITSNKKLIIGADNIFLTFIFDGTNFVSNYNLSGKNVFFGTNLPLFYQPEEQSEQYFSVKFLDINNQLIAEEKVKVNGCAVPPFPPEIEGKTFWYWDGVYTDITANGEVKAKYKSNTYIIRFLDNNGQIIENMSVEHGGDVSPPFPPEIEGKTFWYWDSNLTNIVNDGDIKAVYKENTVLAIFNLDNGSPNVIIEAVYGGDVTEIPRGEKVGYLFLGYDKEPIGLKEDTIFVAQYKKERYSIKFLVDGEVSTITDINYLDTVSSPEIPNKEGHTVLYWGQNGQAYDFSQAISADLVLEAYYLVNYYSVKYIVDNKEILEVKIAHGSHAEFLEVEELNGFVLDAWVKPNNEIFDFDNPIKEDTVIYCIRKRKYEYNITIIAEGNFTATFLYGTFIELNKPKRIGAELEGWYLDPNFTIPFDGRLLMTKGIHTIYAKFIKKDILVNLSSFEDVFSDNEKEYVFSTEEKTVNIPIRTEIGLDTVEPYFHELRGYEISQIYLDKERTISAIGHKVEESITLYPKYQRKRYVVKFCDTNNMIIAEYTIPYLTTPTIPSAVHLEMDMYLGCDNALIPITEDTIFVVNYAPLFLKKYLDKDGNLIKEVKDTLVGTLTPEPPKYTGYDFISYKLITENGRNLIYIAEYQVSTYEVKIITRGNIVVKLERTTYAYGEIASLKLEYDKAMVSLERMLISTDKYAIEHIQSGVEYKFFMPSSDVFIEVIATAILAQAEIKTDLDLAINSAEVDKLLKLAYGGVISLEINSMPNFNHKFKEYQPVTISSFYIQLKHILLGKESIIDFYKVPITLTLPYKTDKKLILICIEDNGVQTFFPIQKSILENQIYRYTASVNKAGSYFILELEQESNNNSAIIIVVMLITSIIINAWYIISHIKKSRYKLSKVKGVFKKASK